MDASRLDVFQIRMLYAEKVVISVISRKQLVTPRSKKSTGYHQTFTPNSRRKKMHQFQLYCLDMQI
jgi:hypothetical protein